MKKDSELYKKIRVHCYIVGLIAFLTALIVGVFLLHNLEKDEKTTGKYMAQITEKRVRARLDQYKHALCSFGKLYQCRRESG